ncbi:MAG: DUF4911 domain-containing protein [Myxococcales bacterium]|nr:DUF4911 domain-containing protein [Myxococcales bacterium]
MVRRYFRIPRANIGLLRFILESYEGLAQLRALPRRAEVEWLIPPELVAQADDLARDLEHELGLVPIDQPPDWPPFEG